MYAVVETGGKQFRVEENAKIIVEKLDVGTGQTVTLDKVLMLGGGDVRLGAPYLDGVAVKAEVVCQGRRPKVLVYKRRRRKDSKTMHGHRQDCTCLLIREIATGAAPEKGE